MDPSKAKENLRKHKVSFERASQVFLDPYMLSIEDEEHSEEEERWITLGLDKSGILFVVHHTFREVDPGSFSIRIISARKPTRGEANSTIQGDGYEKEYDFSKGVRGKFYRPNVRLNLPVYLDDDIAEFVQKYAKRKKVDAQTVVNEILRSNKEMLQALR